MTHCFTPRSVNAEIILASWPTLTQTTSSTSASDGRIRFALERYGHDAFHPRRASLAGKQQRERAIAGDDANGFHG